MYNDQQNNIVNYDYINNKNTLCVVAGAGSGKTTTIIKLIAKLYNDGHNYNEFYITTFTKNAALQLKNKLLNAIDLLGVIDDMNIGTFHSLASKYLLKYNKYNKNYASNFDKILIDYLNLIKTNEYKKNEIHNLIFIDEFQDIDDIQHQIIYELFNTEYNNNKKLLVVIGDDQQNIYTFRGSNLKYILNFEGTQLKLETNYRCIPAVVEISNFLLSYNKNKIEKTYIPYKNNDTKIILKVLNNTNDIIEYILSELNIIKSNKIDLSKFAIISRYNKPLIDLENIFAKNKIPTLYLEKIEDNENYLKKSDLYNNRIILTTIHGTKGLEFENVFFLDFDPDSRSDIEEERRLYYVAITRTINRLTIIVNKKNNTDNNIKCSIFLNEIFNKASDNNTLFKYFDTSYIKPLIYENKNEIVYHYIIVTDICNSISWINLFEINKIINFIDIEYETKNINEKFKILTDKYKKEQLITGYEYLIGYIVENFIEYKILKQQNKYMTGILNYIISSQYNLKYILKNSTYEIKLKEYLKLDNNIDLNNYVKNNIDTLNIYSDLINKEKKIASFEVSSEGNQIKYQKFFLNKIINSYNNLVNFNEENLLENILIYSINKAILNTKRYSLQFLNLDIFEKLLKSIDKTNKFIDIINSYTIFDFNYTKIIMQKHLTYTYNNKTIVGILDILLENEDEFIIIDIKATQIERPQINHLLQILIYSCIYKIISKKKCNIMYIYSALYGNIYKWNINIDENSAILFLNKILETNY